MSAKTGMSEKRDSAKVIGLGVAACAVCCAGPILGFLAAIGLGTIAGIALFGAFALVGAAIVVALVFARRQRRAAACSPATESVPVPVEMPTVRTPQ